MSALVWTAVVLAGGRSTRLGEDKGAADVGGRSLLEIVIASIPVEIPCVVVAPSPPPVTRDVTVAAEAVAFGGPVSGLACGLEYVATPWLALLAVDMPQSGSVALALADQAGAVADDVDALLPADGTGRLQPLAGLYRTEALRRALAELPSTVGVPLHRLVGKLAVQRTVIDLPASALRDIDTADDLEAERRSVQDAGRPQASVHQRAVGEDDTMDAWVEAASAALGLEGDLDVNAILDVAREAAHGVARPMAPVSTFLMGRAVAAGMTEQEAARLLTELAQGWTPDPS